MDRDRPQGDTDETIAPDVAPRKELPLDPAQAVRLERDKYGDSSANPNRDDLLDEHHASPDDIV